jgi:hypothetical protein
VERPFIGVQRVKVFDLIRVRGRISPVWVRDWRMSKNRYCHDYAYKHEAETDAIHCCFVVEVTVRRGDFGYLDGDLSRTYSAVYMDWRWL